MKNYLRIKKLCNSKLFILGIIFLTFAIFIEACAENEIFISYPDFSGEYTYTIDGAENECQAELRTEGEGVLRIRQVGFDASLCWKKDISPWEEHCISGWVDENVLTLEAYYFETRSTCTLDVTEIWTIYLREDGCLKIYITLCYKYYSGDCIGIEQPPCCNSQEITACPCAQPCYENYNPANLSVSSVESFHNEIKELKGL